MSSTMSPTTLELTNLIMPYDPNNVNQEMNFSQFPFALPGLNMMLEMGKEQSTLLHGTSSDEDNTQSSDTEISPPVATSLPPTPPQEGQTVTVKKPRRPMGVKKHYCTFEGCGKAFTTSGHLSRHARIHLNERPYQCTWPGCEKAFSRQDNMRQHLKTHTKVRSKTRRSRNTNGATKFIPYRTPRTKKDPTMDATAAASVTLPESNTASADTLFNCVPGFDLLSQMDPSLFYSQFGITPASAVPDLVTATSSPAISAASSPQINATSVGQLGNPPLLNLALPTMPIFYTDGFSYYSLEGDMNGYQQC